MSNCTIFKKFSTPVGDSSLVDISKSISSDKFKMEIEVIQQLLGQGKTEEAQLKKQQLPAFTPSATFKKKRSLSDVKQYSGFIHLDFDKLMPDQLDKAFQNIIKLPYTALCFRSPSGSGLKVFVEVTSSIELHSMAYLQVMGYYENKTGLKADEKCKDITRLCFFSYDPKLFMTISNKKFNAYPEGVLINTSDPKENSDNWQLIFDECVHFTQQIKKYTTGGRNEFIYQLASNCNRKGIPEKIALQLSLNHYDLPISEIVSSFRSAYSHHLTEFGIREMKNTGISDDLDNTWEDLLKETPIIPDEIFEMLPPILKDGAMVFSDKRKRDSFFTAAISIVSGCLPNVTGIYANDKTYPHLFSFVIAPAASGKGVLRYAKAMADLYHQEVLKTSYKELERHRQEMDEYNSLLKSKRKNDPIPEKPIPVPFKVVFIPADSSYARMIEHLHNNGGQGIICETEADTMSKSKKQEWGDYSPLLRAVFHSETITFTRKGNNEYIEINEPRLAVSLAGTPGQVSKLIVSAEDGLFSRFLFYVFKGDVVWQDASPKNRDVVYSDHFASLSHKLLHYTHFLEQSPTKVHLEPEQWEKLNKTFSDILSDVVTFTNEEASSIVYRLGLISYRICMIFSALRKAEYAETTTDIICTEEDFISAIMIAKTYLNHSILIYNNLPKNREVLYSRGGDSKRKFFKALPKQFTRKEALALGFTFKLSTRTIDEILRNSCGKTLVKLKSGVYQRK